MNLNSLGPGSEIDGFCLGELLHAGSMAAIYRLTGPDGALPLIIKVPRLGPGERAVNVIAFEVCRMVLGALAQGPNHPTLVAFGDVETTPYLVMEYLEGQTLAERLIPGPLEIDDCLRIAIEIAVPIGQCGDGFVDPRPLGVGHGDGNKCDFFNHTQGSFSFSGFNL